MYADKAAAITGASARRYESPWRRLPWTGPPAVLAWIGALWLMSLAMIRAPATPSRPPTINASIIELREPPPPQAPEPAARTPAPQARTQTMRRQEAAPAVQQPEQTMETAAIDLPQVQGAAAQEGETASASPLPAAAAPASAPAPGGRPGLAVRDKAVGVTGRAAELSVNNEDQTFDINGDGHGVSLGGWMQESAEPCPTDLYAGENSCKAMVFSQPGRPWCYDANPVHHWDVGTCGDDLSRGIAAFKREDYLKAFALFKKLAERDFYPAQSNLADMYADGKGVPKDDRQAAHWYRKAAIEGDPKAAYNLASMYSEGKGLEKDEQQAAHWYRKAALLGYSAAQYNLGAMYALGIGLPQDNKQAAFWYRKAAERGNALAQYNLGAMYADGTSVAKDERQAVAWYCRASARGESNARSALIQLVATGVQAPKENALAYFCWLIAAAKRAPLPAYRDRAQYEKGLTSEQIAQAKAAAEYWKPK